jgi:hypothetical protein
MTKDCIRRNSRKETRSYYTILDTSSLAKENYKANGWIVRRTFSVTIGSGNNHGRQRKSICCEWTTTQGIPGA